jgi:hypothetical protein
MKAIKVNRETKRRLQAKIRHERKLRRIQLKKAKAKNKVSGQFMNRVVICDILAALIFTVVMIVLFAKTGSEPSTLIENVFRFLSVEGGAMALIKVSKTVMKPKTETPQAEPEETETTAETEEE